MNSIDSFTGQEYNYVKPNTFNYKAEQIKGIICQDAQNR